MENKVDEEDLSFEDFEFLEIQSPGIELNKSELQLTKTHPGGKPAFIILKSLLQRLEEGPNFASLSALSEILSRRIPSVFKSFSADDTQRCLANYLARRNLAVLLRYYTADLLEFVQRVETEDDKELVELSLRVAGQLRSLLVEQVRLSPTLGLALCQSGFLNELAIELDELHQTHGIKAEEKQEPGSKADFSVYSLQQGPLRGCLALLLSCCPLRGTNAFFREAAVLSTLLPLQKAPSRDVRLSIHVIASHVTDFDDKEEMSSETTSQLLQLDNAALTLLLERLHKGTEGAERTPLGISYRGLLTSLRALAATDAGRKQLEARDLRQILPTLLHATGRCERSLSLGVIGALAENPKAKAFIKSLSLVGQIQEWSQDPRLKARVTWAVQRLSDRPTTRTSDGQGREETASMTNGYGEQRAQQSQNRPQPQTESKRSLVPTSTEPASLESLPSSSRSKSEAKMQQSELRSASSLQQVEPEHFTEKVESKLFPRENEPQGHKDTASFLGVDQAQSLPVTRLETSKEQDTAQTHQAETLEPQSPEDGKQIPEPGGMQCQRCPMEESLKILPCLHYFCLHCLLDLPTTKKDHVVCPECNRLFTLLGGPQNAPDAHLALEVVGQASDPIQSKIQQLKNFQNNFDVGQIAIYQPTEERYNKIKEAAAKRQPSRAEGFPELAPRLSIADSASVLPCSRCSRFDVSLLLLSCTHSFCEGCLRPYRRTLPTGIKEVTCPTCDFVCPLGNRDVGELKKANFSKELQSLRNITINKEECSSCAGRSSQIPRFYCLSRGQWLCFPCAETRENQSPLIDCYSLLQSMTESTKCARHNRVFQLFCERCQQLLCDKCQPEHAAHAPWPLTQDSDELVRQLMKSADASVVSEQRQLSAVKSRQKSGHQRIQRYNDHLLQRIKEQKEALDEAQEKGRAFAHDCVKNVQIANSNTALRFKLRMLVAAYDSVESPVVRHRLYMDMRNTQHQMQTIEKPEMPPVPEVSDHEQTATTNGTACYLQHLVISHGWEQLVLRPSQHRQVSPSTLGICVLSAPWAHAARQHLANPDAHGHPGPLRQAPPKEARHDYFVTSPTFLHLLAQHFGLDSAQPQVVVCDAVRFPLQEVAFVTFRSGMTRDVAQNHGDLETIPVKVNVPLHEQWVESSAFGVKEMYLANGGSVSSRDTFALLENDQNITFTDYSTIYVVWRE